MWKSASTSAVHWLVGQLSEVKNWATSGAQLGIVVLQVCITPTKSYQIREHYPELLASAREFYIRDQPKFLTNTLKILPGILLLLPQKPRAHCTGKHQTDPIQRNLSGRWKHQNQSVSDLFLLNPHRKDWRTKTATTCHTLSSFTVVLAQRSRHCVKHRHQVKNPKRNEEFQKTRCHHCRSRTKRLKCIAFSVDSKRPLSDCYSNIIKPTKASLDRDHC